MNASIDHNEKPDDTLKGATGGKTDAELYPLAVSTVMERKRASVTLVQRVWGCGFNQAARLLELMAENRLGVVRREDCHGLFEFGAGLAGEK